MSLHSVPRDQIYALHVTVLSFSYGRALPPDLLEIVQILTIASLLSVPFISHLLWMFKSSHL